MRDTTGVSGSFLIRDMPHPTSAGDDRARLIITLLLAFKWDASTRITLGDVAMISLTKRRSGVWGALDDVWNTVRHMDAWDPAVRMALVDIAGRSIQRCTTEITPPRYKKKIPLEQLNVLNGDFSNFEDLMGMITRDLKSAPLNEAEIRRQFDDLIRAFPPLHPEVATLPPRL